jgi:hypothetical protein
MAKQYIAILWLSGLTSIPQADYSVDKWKPSPRPATSSGTSEDGSRAGSGLLS